MEKLADEAADSVNGDTSGMRTSVISKCGGYDYRFVALLSDGSDLMCKICHLPSQHPYLSSCCGHTFCKSCIDGLKETEVSSNACPVCRDGEFPVVQNKQIDRAIRCLHVYCTNEKEGCKWEGEINDIVGHLSCCQYESVECENSGCGNTVQRQHLKSHMELDCPYREVKCHRCGIIGSHQFIEKTHEDKCPQSPLPCPNGCEVGNVPRQELDKHREICPLEMINCEYHDMGCDSKILRKDSRDHNRENVEEHLRIVKCELARTKKDLVQAQKDAATAERKLVDIQKKFQDQTDEKKLADLQNKFLERINDTEAHGRESIKRLEMQFYNSICQLHKHCNPWRLKLNALAAVSTSDEQVVPVILKVTDFSKMRREKEWWYSDYFYSHDKECKMRLSVYAGDDTDAYISVQLSLVYVDSELPLRGNIKLLNQINDYGHYCVTVDCCDTTNNTVAKNEWMIFSEWKNSSFISYTSLNAVSSTCNFIKKDCLFFEVYMGIGGDSQPASQQPLFPDNEEDISCVTNLTDSFSSPKANDTLDDGDVSESENASDSRDVLGSRDMLDSRDVLGSKDNVLGIGDDLRKKRSHGTAGHGTGAQHDQMQTTGSCNKCSVSFARVLKRKHTCTQCGKTYCGPCTVIVHQSTLETMSRLSKALHSNVMRVCIDCSEQLKGILS